MISTRHVRGGGGRGARLLPNVCERDIRDRPLLINKYADCSTRGTLDLCSNFRATLTQLCIRESIR